MTTQPGPNDPSDSGQADAPAPGQSQPWEAAAPQNPWDAAAPQGPPAGGGWDQGQTQAYPGWGGDPASGASQGGYPGQPGHPQPGYPAQGDPTQWAYGQGQQGGHPQAGYGYGSEQPYGYGSQQPYGYPAQGYPAQGYPAYQPPRQTEGKAVPALVLAICSWVVCPVLLAIAALFMISQSNRAIEASGGRLDGASMNTATKWVAWINIIVYGIGIVLFLVFLVVITLSAPDFWHEFGSAFESGYNDGTQF